jgi:hypothetical protein
MTEFFRFYDHMADSHWRPQSELVEGKLPTVEIHGSVLQEDDDLIIVGAVKCQWFDKQEEFRETWYIIKKAILERRDVHYSEPK